MEEPVAHLAAGVVRRVRGPATSLALADLGFFDAVRLPQSNVLDPLDTVDVQLLLPRRLMSLFIGSSQFGQKSPQVNSVVDALVFGAALLQGEVLRN